MHVRIVHPSQCRKIHRYFNYYAVVKMQHAKYIVISVKLINVRQTRKSRVDLTFYFTDYCVEMGMAQCRQPTVLVIPTDNSRHVMFIAHAVVRSDSCKNVLLRGCRKLRGSISYFLATSSSQVNVEVASDVAPKH